MPDVNILETAQYVSEPWSEIELDLLRPHLHSPLTANIRAHIASVTGRSEKDIMGKMTRLRQHDRDGRLAAAEPNPPTVMKRRKCLNCGAWFEEPAPSFLFLCRNHRNA